MGRSCGSTTSQAANNWRMTSSWPTQLIGSSSGCARCSATPSISTTIAPTLAETVQDTIERMGAAKIPLSAEEFDNPILHCGSQESLADPAGRPKGGDLDRAQVARTRAGRH